MENTKRAAKEMATWVAASELNGSVPYLSARGGSELVNETFHDERVHLSNAIGHVFKRCKDAVKKAIDEKRRTSWKLLQGVPSCQPRGDRSHFNCYASKEELAHVSKMKDITAVRFPSTAVSLKNNGLETNIYIPARGGNPSFFQCRVRLHSVYEPRDGL